MVQFVVVPGAKWMIVKDIEVGGLERLPARFADETTAVVTASETAVCRADRFALDELVTPPTFAFVDSGRLPDWGYRNRGRRWRCWREP